MQVYCFPTTGHQIVECVAGKPKSETQKRKDKSQAVTERMMDTLAKGQFTDKVRDLDSRFSQSLANFITGDPPAFFSTP